MLLVDNSKILYNVRRWYGQLKILLKTYVGKSMAMEMLLTENLNDAENSVSVAMVAAA